MRFFFPPQSWPCSGLRYPQTDSIQAADVSLCVLSLPDVLKHDGSRSEVEIPSILRPFISSRTLFLLNKSDLVHSPPSLDTASHRSWIASLRTGEGTAEFMAGFTKALHEQLRRSLSLTSDGIADIDINARFDLCDDTTESPVITHARHRVHLETALRHLEAALDIRKRCRFFVRGSF